MTAAGIAALPDSSMALSADQDARHTRLLRAAQQFEAVMLGELMKPLAGNAAIGEDSEAATANPMQSFGVESMAGALARSGALGFAQRMVASVERSALGSAKNKG